MNRVNIFYILNNIVPTYSVGQIKGTLDEDCCVLRRGVDIPSLSNSLGHWDSWNIDIYSPESPVKVDDIVDVIKDTLKNICEVESMTTGDYYDEVMRAFSTTLTIRIPNIY